MRMLNVFIAGVFVIQTDPPVNKKIAENLFVIHCN